MDAIVKVLDDLNIVILLKELVNVDEEIAKLKLKQDKLKKKWRDLKVCLIIKIFFKRLLVVKL